MRYLRSEATSNALILHILNSKVDLKLADALGASSKMESMRRIEQGKKLPNTSSDTKMNKVKDENTGEEDAKRLRQVLEAVRSGPSPLPTSCLYRLSKRSQAVTSSTISQDASLLAAGSEGSTVEVWNLLPETLERLSAANSEYEDNLGAQKINSLVEQQRRRDEIILGCDRRIWKAKKKKIRLKSENCQEDSDQESEEEAAEEANLQKVEMCSLYGHRGPVYGVEFMCGAMDQPREPPTHLLSVSEDTTMRLWDLKSRSNKAIYHGHSYPVWCLSVDALAINVATGKLFFFF